MRKSFLQTILGVFYPKRCNGCNRQGTALCETCLLSIPLAPILEKDTDFAVFDYGHPIIRQSLWQFKYHHDATAMRILTTLSVPYIETFIAEVLQSTTSQSIVLVPIPQHRKKAQQRGYNQSLLIAKWLARHIERSIVQELLIKTVPTLPQARIKSKSARKNNSINTMKAKVSVDPKVLYILIDDVTTTGATLNEARRALRQNGGKKILSVSIAHGYLLS
jgi:competence protein ComFC